MNITREDIAWAAGVFEGEGCIARVSPTKNSYRVSVGMTDKDVVDRFHSIFQFGNRTVQDRTSKGWKVCYTWQTGNREHVQAFLAMIWPWLGDRRKTKAEEAIRAINNPIRDKLSLLVARDIRDRWDENTSDLADEFGVHRNTIYNVINNKTWKEKINE